MAVWTDIANLAYKAVLSSTLVNTLLENTRYLKEQSDARLAELRTERGSASLTSPTTTVATTATINFATPFATPPIVNITTPISSGGTVIDAFAVSVTTAGFSIRYRATAAWGSNQAVDWSAIGTRA